MLFLGGEANGQNIEIPDNLMQCLIPVESQSTKFLEQVYVRKQIVFMEKTYTVMAHGSDEDILKSFYDWYLTAIANPKNKQQTSCKKSSNS